MLKIKLGKKGGAEQYGDHHQVMVELMPVCLGIVIVLILGLLVYLLLQQSHMMDLIAELAARIR